MAASVSTQGEVLGFFDGAREIWDAMGYTEDDLDDDDDDDDGESRFISHAERAAVVVWVRKQRRFVKTSSGRA